MFKTSGFIQALVDLTATVSGSTYSAGLAKRGAIAAGAAAQYEVYFEDILAGEVTQFYRWSPNLPANVSLISPNEFGVFEATGDLLLDSTKPVDGDLGRFGCKYDVTSDAA